MIAIPDLTPLPAGSPLDGVPAEYSGADHKVWRLIARYFSPREFEAPEKMDASFLALIYAARCRAGVPFRIIDTVRADKRSAHGELPCTAMDLQLLSSRERSRVVRALHSVGFTRVGVYPGKDRDYNGRAVRDAGGLHVDGSRTKPADVLWTLGIRS